MKPLIQASGSLRRRLISQLLVLAAVLSLLLYIIVRVLADQAAERTQDHVLGASAAAIAEEVRVERGRIRLDLPYSALSMLGAISEDRVFYRIYAAGQTLTGYDDLPNPTADPGRTRFETAQYRGEEVRLVTVTRQITLNGTPTPVAVQVAQTRLAKTAVSDRISNAAALLGIGFFVLAGVASWLAAEYALRPLDRLTRSVAARGPSDLRALRTAAPSELVPLLEAFNGFIDRLRTALNRTEDFIAEAAHRVRTPLATVRTQAEIAMRHADNPDHKRALRGIIRAVDESARSAGQILDHAMVTYRRDRPTRERVNLNDLVKDVIRALGPTADMRDITLTPLLPNEPLHAIGDPILLQGAVRNLLDNAIKYSPPDSTVNLLLTVEGPEAQLRICDQGRGLGGAPQTELEQRFGRGRNVDDIIGSGLGLTIVAEVADDHGGRFTLTPNDEGTGTCACLFLPHC